MTSRSTKAISTSLMITKKTTYQGVFTLVRIEGIETVPHYSRDFIEHSHSVLIGQKTSASVQEQQQLLNRHSRVVTGTGPANG